MAKKGGGLSESCDATLRINGEDYEGSTGKGTGHAEMTALDEFITSNPADAATIKLSIAACAAILLNPATPKSVSCPSRPCCLKCSRVLKALKFGLAAGTEWSDKSMGSTEWGVSLNVRELLKQCKVNYEEIKALS